MRLLWHSRCKVDRFIYWVFVPYELSFVYVFVRKERLVWCAILRRNSSEASNTLYVGWLLDNNDTGKQTSNATICINVTENERHRRLYRRAACKSEYIVLHMWNEQVSVHTPSKCETVKGRCNTTVEIQMRENTINFCCFINFTTFSVTLVL